MMLGRADLKRLRLPLVAALLLSGIGIAALAYSEKTVAEAENLKNLGQARLLASRDRLTKVSEEEMEIRSHLGQFKQFQDRGMAGPEKRLEWIEALAAIRQKHRLFQVQYNLEPQRPVDYPGVAQDQSGAGAIFIANRVKLDLSLLHEEDLLNFLADLSTAAGSFGSLRSCNITRTERAGAGGGPLRARLRANCVIDMITLKAADKT